MPELPLYNEKGKNIGEVPASDKIFNRAVNEHVVQSALRWFQACQRRGTHSSKRRGEVRGGGVKPWRQKGTGRARAGSIRSPLWRKGGVIFGPKPRTYAYALPRKVRKLALSMALSDKVKEGKLKVVEQFKLSEPKTKQGVSFLKELGVSGRVLIILGSQQLLGSADEAFTRASRNISGVNLILVKDLNVFDLLFAEWIVTDKKALSQMEEVLAGAS